MMAQTVATVKVALHIRPPERVVFQPQHGNQLQRPKFNLLCRHLPYCQAPFLNTMQDVSKLDSTISAMCQRRSQLQSQVVTEQVCMYECLAAHTASGSLTMQGALGGESGRVPTPPPMPVQKRA